MVGRLRRPSSAFDLTTPLTFPATPRPSGSNHMQGSSGTAARDRRSTSPRAPNGAATYTPPSARFHNEAYARQFSP